MRALVAGGAGFIGSHLCERLLGDGHEVFALDNFITGREVNLASFVSNPWFHLVTTDIVQPLPSLPHVDQIYNLASPASPPGYQVHPIETLRVNSEGSRHLLELAERDNATYLYASTSEAYGDPLEHPQRESYRGNVSSTGPRSMYDEAKRYGEALTMAYSRTRNVDARIVRIFNTYGPRSDPTDGRLVPNFVTQSLRGEPITVYSDGSQTRSLCYVSDLADGLVRAMNATSARGEVTNLGNPDEHTVLEFASIINELVGGRSTIKYTAQAVGDDPQRRKPDITLARKRLGWEPTVGLKDGLRQTIAAIAAELGIALVAEPLVSDTLPEAASRKP